MAPLLGDGSYKISNIKHGDTLLAQLSQGKEYGTVIFYNVSGNTLPDSAQWTVENIGGPNENKVILRNKATRVIYASASGNADDAPLLGLRNPTIWTVTKLTPEKYNFLTSTGHLWTATQNNREITVKSIVLGDDGAQEWKLTSL